MKKPFLTILTLTLTLFTLFPIVVGQSGSVYHSLSVDPMIHDDYGLTYPVTYEFSIPNGASNLKAYKKFRLEEAWAPMVEKTSNDFFNGIEAVRFDYANNRAYVSISFRSDSDSIYIYFSDSDGNEINTEFVGITEYYDNRRVAVVFTTDDITGYGDNFARISEVFADAKVWLTAAVITGSAAWQVIQDGVNRGYVEIASHSRTHPHCPYSDYDSEIGGSKQDIVSNLTLPSLYRKGNKEYVWCWVEPYGESDANVQYTLGNYKYLVSRIAWPMTGGPTYYEQWNYDYGLFNRANVSVLIDTSTLEYMNSVFDYVYSVGGIYHAWGHLSWYGIEPGDKSYEHVQYVKNKKDVWYVGFGGLYAYAFVRMHVQYMSVAISPTHVKMHVGQSQTFSSSVSGGVPPYTYKWFLNDTIVTGATDSSWTFTPKSEGYYAVYVNVTDATGLSVKSNVAEVLACSVYLLMTIDSSRGRIAHGQPVTFTVNVFNSLDPVFESSLTLTVNGPRNYGYFDVQPIRVPAGTVGEYSFTWTVPDVAGTYMLEVRLAPAQLTAYDAVWLKVT